MTAPQDRQKAIVEAAQAFLSAFDSAECVSDMGSNQWNARDRLEAALALPEPEWTRTPPTEPGRYWVRFRSALTGNMEREIAQLAQDRRVWILGEHRDEALEEFDGEWLPLPVSPPSTGGTKT